MKDATRKTLAFLVLAVIAAVIFTVTSVAGRVYDSAGARYRARPEREKCG